MENNEVGDVSRTPIVPQSNQGKKAEEEDSSSAPPKDQKTVKDKKTEFEIYWSPKLKMLTNAKNLDTLYTFLSENKDKLFENTPLEKTALGRALKVWGIDFPIADFFQTIQHELGHDTRVREFGGNATFKITNPWNISDMTSSHVETRSMHSPITSFYDPEISPFYPKFWDKEVKATAGGMEADKVMADHILEKMHTLGKTNHNSNLEYLASKWNRSGYVFISDYPNQEEIGREFWGFFYPEFALREEKFRYDPRAYVRELFIKNWFDTRNWDLQDFQYKGPSIEKLTRSLKTAAVWSALSPAALKAFGDEIKYISNGKRDFKMPKSFLDTDFALGPEGPEFYLNYFTRTVKDSPQKFYARHCPIGEKSYGLGMKTFGKTGEKTALTLGTDLWLQEKKMGGNLELELKRNLLKDVFLGLHAGYKTKGHMPGYPDQPGPYFGAGAEWRF